MSRPRTEVDIDRTAALLIRQHGEAAFLVAAQRCDDMTAREDPDGVRTWTRIMAAMEELQSVTPSEGARTH